MAAQANIVVYDGAGTPASHTLTGISVSKEKGEVTAVWRETNPALPVYAQVMATAKLKRLPNGVYRVSFRTEVPVMEAILNQNAAGYTASPKVAYVNTVEIVGYFHERSSGAERRLVRQMALNVGGSISTSVSPAVTGPVPDLFDYLISVT